MTLYDAENLTRTLTEIHALVGRAHAHDGRLSELASCALSGVSGLSMANHELRQENEHLHQQIRGYQAEVAEVDQTLGRALGYPTLGPEAGGDHGTVCTGESTPASLAAEAAGKLDRLAAEVGRLRQALSLVQRRWTFDNNQQPTHTWHDWADCKAVIEAALDAQADAAEPAAPPPPE